MATSDVVEVARFDDGRNNSRGKNILLWIKTTMNGIPVFFTCGLCRGGRNRTEDDKRESSLRAMACCCLPCTCCNCCCCGCGEISPKQTKDVMM